MSADVLVVGAGPAGSVTALLLARRGWDVTLLERSSFPRPKACGECLNPGAVAALRRLGLLQRVLSLQPATLDGWEVRAGASRGHASFGTGVGKGLSLPRARLDDALLQAALEAGASVEHGVKVRAVSPWNVRSGRTVEVREPDGGRGARTGRVLVGADGLRSVVARAVGGPRRPPRLRKLSLTLRVRGSRRDRGSGLLVLSPELTVGLAPVSAQGNLWNLTVVTAARRWGRRVARDPLAFALAAAAEADLGWTDGPEVVGGPWASGPFDRPLRSVAGPGVALVGDAAGYYDPLTGQGIYRALRSAELASVAIDRALRSGGVSGSFRGYRLRHRVSFTPGRTVQRVVEEAVSRGSLCERVVGRLGSSPRALATLFAVTGDALPATRLLGPGVLWPLIRPARGRHSEDAREPAGPGCPSRGSDEGGDGFMRERCGRSTKG